MPREGVKKQATSSHLLALGCCHLKNQAPSRPTSWSRSGGTVSAPRLSACVCAVGECVGCVNVKEASPSVIQVSRLAKKTHRRRAVILCFDIYIPMTHAPLSHSPIHRHFYLTKVVVVSACLFLPSVQSPAPSSTSSSSPLPYITPSSLPCAVKPSLLPCTAVLYGSSCKRSVPPSPPGPCARRRKGRRACRHWGESRSIAS